MSCILRGIVRNKQRREEAQKNGNTSLLFGLIVLGGLLFAGYSLLSGMHHVHHSLRSIFKSLVDRNTAKQVGNKLAQEPVQKVLEYSEIEKEKSNE